MSSFGSHQWLSAELGTRPHPVPLLLLLCICFSVAAHERLLQDEVVPEIEFDVKPTDIQRTGRRVVVSGWFYVRGEFTLGSLGDVAFASRQMLSNICDNNLPALALARQDILTVNQPTVGLNMSFYVLPPEGWAHYCVAMLRFAGFGPTQPPFTTVPAPPIRGLLEASIAQNTGFNERLMESWVIDIGNVNCGEMAISYGEADSPALLLERSRMPQEWLGREEPAPCGSIEAKWSAASSVQFPWEEEPCLSAASPCICASIRTCRYLPVPGGGKRCTTGWETAFDVTSVSCEDCPYQPQCPPTCKDAYTPCMCTFWNCTWDDSRDLCTSFDPEAGDLSCLLCSRQPHCVGLEAIRVDPPEWSLLGDTGWLVNVTFNRNIMFGPLMESEPNAMHFTCQSEEEAGMVPPVFVTFPVSMDMVRIVEDTLRVDAKKVPNPLRLRFCQLNIYVRAILDSYYIPFEGTWQSHRFLLGDMVAPTLLSIWPDNTARDIPLDVRVELVFSETVTPGMAANGHFSLVSLGGEGLGGPENEVVEVFSATSSRVLLGSTTLVIELGGLLRHDIFYSVGVAADAVQDEVGNKFSGVPVGIYAFRTVAAKTHKVLGNSESLSLAFIFTVTFACALGFLLMLVGIIALWQRRRPQKILPTQLAEVQEAAQIEDRRELESMKELQNLKSWNGHESFETLFEELRMLQKVTAKDANVVAYQPPLDDHYYATMEPLSAGSSTVLEPDMSIINKARPISASRRGERGTAPQEAVEVYSYYAFPPPWSAEELACPPSCGPPALMDQESELPTPSSKTVEEHKDRAANRARRRPASATERSKMVIKSLHDSFQSPTAQQRPQRPQSAPSQRPQDMLMRRSLTAAATVFRDSNSRLATTGAVYQRAEAQRQSRPSSAVKASRQAPTQAICDYDWVRPSVGRKTSRPGSAGAIRKSRTEPAATWERTDLEDAENDHFQFVASSVRSHQRKEATRNSGGQGGQGGQGDGHSQSDGPGGEGHGVQKASDHAASASGQSREGDVRGSKPPADAVESEEEDEEEDVEANGVEQDELRNLGNVPTKPRRLSVHYRGSAFGDLHNTDPNLRSRQSRISMVAEQGSDLHTWEMMLKKASPISKKPPPEHSPRATRGVGQPWTWQAESIDAVDAQEHQDSLTSREQTKSRAWNRKSYIWDFKADEEADEKPGTKVEANDQGSVGKRHEALGIRSRSSVLRSTSLQQGSEDQLECR